MRRLEESYTTSPAVAHAGLWADVSTEGVQRRQAGPTGQRLRGERFTVDRDHAGGPLPVHGTDGPDRPRADRTGGDRGGRRARLGIKADRPARASGGGTRASRCRRRHPAAEATAQKRRQRTAATTEGDGERERWRRTGNWGRK
uniref:Uncharacterized protein n=1 Tax=Oryza sativa subsp. japonica TaxID=39947 RepID=Q6YWE4_ORYSJ|nr:hypothetical protein [Oryza sativa Japonica Group]BAD16397.1 hypothetical protein [Oryza sativa Japonica Group]